MPSYNITSILTLPALKKILIVEDDPDTIEMIEAFLTMSGYAVIKINREISMREVAGINPSLAILDYLTPYMLGNELCSLIKNHPETQHIPVLLYSASAVGKEIASACRADAYLPKPFDLDHLLSVIQQLAN